MQAICCCTSQTSDLEGNIQNTPMYAYGFNACDAPLVTGRSGELCSIPSHIIVCSETLYHVAHFLEHRIWWFLQCPGEPCSKPLGWFCLHLCLAVGQVHGNEAVAEGMIQDITLKSIPGFRDFASQAIMDVMYYLTPE